MCREVGRLLRAHAGLLLLSGLLIFVPLGLIEASLEVVPEAGTPAIALGESIAAGAGSVLVSLLGEVFYIAIVSAAVLAGARGQTINVGAVLAGLPLGRLLGADLAYAVLVTAGLIFLLVPGLIFLAWFALVAPGIEVEHRGFADAFRRSRDLVRPHFWLVLGITVPLALGSELISELAFSGSSHVLGHSFAGEWAGSVLAELLTAPILALFVVVLFLRLRENSPDPGA